MQVDAPHRSPSPNRTPSATDSNSAPPTKDALPPAADDSELPPLPASDDLSSSHIAPQLTEDSQLGNSDGSALLAPHVKRHLMDIESSFVPDASPSGPSAPHAPAADDTYLFGGSPGRTAHLTKTPAAEGESEEAGSGAGASDKSEPAHRGAEAESDVTTDLSGLPSSPLANAMKRQGRANGDKVNSNTLPTTASRKMHNDDESGTDPLAVSEMGPPPLPKSGRASRRPAFLQNRQASQRSSASSIARSDVSGGTDITLGADYALQSGGAVPTSRSGNGDLSLSRLPSIGSITSLTSSHSDNLPQYHRTRSSTSTTSLAVDTALSRLEEEENSSQPATPRAGSMAAPSDTVIAQHVQNIHVPETVAREYRAKHSSAAGSDDRRQTIGLSYSTRSKHNLTLKEQNSKIDKLSKENFDLKLKIHFLDQALQNRSDEGVMEMISKNVQLQTDLANEKKDNASLRRKIRDLERKLKAQEEESDKKPHPDGDASDDDDEKAEMEEEISYLRETIEQMQTEMVRLKGENFSKEKEKRRLAEYVKAMGEMRPTEPTSGVEETIEMWKDLLQAETARREAADEDAVKLRDEINQLKAEQSATNNMRSVYSMKRQGSVYGARSEAGGSEAPPSRDGTREGGGADSRASTLVVEQLKHENAELRRDLSAQTSMLTSRNRERERLQQEIEDLKIQHRRGGLEAGGGGLGPSAARSIAGDSIFDRSVSRAHVRSSSRASGVTRATGMSEPEREDLERKLGGMRDELAQVKMLNQDLEKALNEQLDAVEAMETENRQLKQEGMLAVEDLQAMQTERDDLLLTIQEKDNDFDTLRAQAVENIDKLEEEYEQKETEFNTLQNDFNALQSEFKTVSENAVRLEDELNASRRKEETLEQQIEEAEREIEELEQKVQDTSAKCERLDVQLENSQNETAFLREEQEGDKIKIGELEGSLATTQTTIEDMLAQAKEERRQRDLIDNKEKAEVQKVLDEINAQAATAKDELRKLRKKLADKEREAETWKERLETLESNLREALGDLNGTRSSLLKVSTLHTREAC
jgi:predicted  nucleic acid-binding Zn-ribbon protein